MTSTLLLVDKPQGITSFDVIRRLRRELAVKKMGHAGTLDPMATGLMLIGINEGTKELANLIGLPKVYEAEILLGVKTDTGDITGRIIEESNIRSQNTKEEIEAVLQKMVGKLSLVAPAYSAIKQGGVPLYKKARAGKEVIAPVREMEIKEMIFHGTREGEGKFFLNVELEVSSGTYVRSIAEEIGRRLGTVATLSALRRTKIGDFEIKDARKI
jgi:tRNA pseudouridine55 synthase